LPLTGATLLALLSLLLPVPLRAASTEERRPDPNQFMVVDCLLPAQVRRLGGMTYAAARRAIKASTLECEARGGEYVAFDRANYATTLKVWLPLAEEGNPEAQTYVGEAYEKGLGVAPDYAAAAHWYLNAAEQGLKTKAGQLDSLIADEKEKLKTLSGLTPEQAIYFSTHEEADLKEHEGGIMGHGTFRRMVLQRLLEDGMAEVRPGYSIEYCSVTSVDLYGAILQAVLNAG